jgi:YidC/Oxa1 family membrane protein insertase
MPSRPLILLLCLGAAVIGAAEPAEPAPAPAPATPVVATEAAPAVTPAAVAAPPASFTAVTIANAKARVVLSTQRGGIASFELMDEHPTVLALPLRRKAGANAAQPGDEKLPLAVLGNFKGETGRTDHNLHNNLDFFADAKPNIDFTFNMPWEIRSATPTAAVLGLRLDDRGIDVELGYTMDPTLPRVHCVLRIRNTGTAVETIHPTITPFIGIHQDYPPGEVAYVCGAVHSGGDTGSVSKHDFSTEVAKQALAVDASTDYVALKSRFFAALWAPGKPARVEGAVPAVAKEEKLTGLAAGEGKEAGGWTAQLVPFKDPAGHNQGFITVGLASLDVPPGSVYLDDWSITCVGMSKGSLAPLSEAEKHIQYTDGMYRFFKMLAKALTWCLDLIHAGVRNYGIALVVLTILLKAALHRTTFKQQESMLKMQRLAPELKLLQERHKNDRQALGVKTMELYKKNGVNPLGGCLPILIQMPMFMALFQVFSHNADMRGEHFLWAHDLTLPDAVWGPSVSWLSWATINPLALIYIGVTVWMSFTTKPPTGGDEQQAQMMKMMRWMPVIFGVVFYSMPAGLVLYFTVNAILSTLEIRYVKRKLGMP